MKDHLYVTLALNIKHELACKEASNLEQVIPKLQERKLNQKLADSKPVILTLT